MTPRAHSELRHYETMMMFRRTPDVAFAEQKDRMNLLSKLRSFLFG